jgi:hypothetical protein
MLNGGITAGYKIFGYTYYEGKKRKTKQIPFRKLVAEYFLPKPNKDQIYVINIDYNRKNDFVNNLKWVTREEYLAHTDKSPKLIALKQRNRDPENQRNGSKLTVTRAKILKKKIFDPKRKTRLPILAKQFGISEAQIYRIKRGDSWGNL